MIEDVRVTHSGVIIFTDRTPDDFTATVALTVTDLKQLLNALPAEHQDAVIADVEKRRAKEAVAELLADRRADREERANRRREMRQELIDSRPPYRFAE